MLLVFDLITGILFFVYKKGNPLFVLYGVLTLTLCGADALHLVPRIKRAIYGTNDKIKRQLGIGLQVSSITMTVFYIIVYLEISISNISSSTLSRGYDLDFNNYSYRCLFLATK